MTTTLIRSSVVLALLFLAAGQVVAQDQPANLENVGARPARWDGALTADAEKRILAEIKALGKRARGELTQQQLTVVGEVIDQELAALRRWAKSHRYRSENRKSVGPWFSEFIRRREKGTDVRRAPQMSKGAGIAGLTVGSKSAKGERRHEASFSWTAAENGKFTKEWTPAKPVDEEYQVAVTARLRLYLLIDMPIDQKMVRVQVETKKDIFKQRVITLKATDAKVIKPINSK